MKFRTEQAFEDYMTTANQITKEKNQFEVMKKTMELIPALLEHYYDMGYNEAMAQKSINLSKLN